MVAQFSTGILAHFSISIYTIILVLIDSISIKFYNSKFTLICSILIHPCANIMKVPFIILYEWHFFIVFRQDKTVISSFPCFSFAAV